MNFLTFAFVIDEDVFHYLQIPNDPNLEGVIAGLKSGPKIVEVPQEMTAMVGAGWKYVDGQFVIPNEIILEDDYEVED